MRSGLANTSLCNWAEPSALTMPSPTRATIVSSDAPPINCRRFARTVTRAFTFNWIPFCAMPSRVSRPVLREGQSITFG